MQTLTNIQKEFIADTFFKDERFAGWKTISLILLSKGECVVAGNDCIWKGGIGNFIETKNAPLDTVGCILYKFDLDEFLSSEYFQYERLVKIEKLKTIIEENTKVMDSLTLI